MILRLAFNKKSVCYQSHKGVRTIIKIMRQFPMND